MAMLLILMLAVTSPLIVSSKTIIHLDLSGDNWIASTKGMKVKLNATVPGSMYTDLFANHLISDPYKRYNDANYAKYAEEDWEYTLNFQALQHHVVKTSIDLVCEGIDTVSAVYLNGNQVGRTSNQFVRYRFPVKDHLKLGMNELSVRFTSAVSYAASQSKAYPYSVPPECPPPVQHGQCHPNFIRKEQASFSWDWGPSFPTQGIWKNIWLQAYDKVVLDDFSAEISLSDASTWVVKIQGYIQGVETLSHVETYRFTAVLEGTGINRTSVLNFDHHSSSTINTSLVVDKKLLKLWWPNGYGQQPLYNLSVSLSQAQPNWQQKRVGFRTVELIQEPIKGVKGLSFYFKINGMPIFMKGSNWIPADSFQSRITRDKLTSLLGSAKLAHMNMLRVWGGGIYEQETFYELADKMGILIWQDIMFACAMYPVDSQFLSSVQLEVSQQVRRLKHHASLALWAGNNENEAALRDNWYNTKDQFSKYKADYIKLYIDTVKPTVNREHSTGIFVSSSPSNAAESEQEGWIAQNPYDTKYGDVHYYDYTAGRYYKDDYPRSRFLSEYGYQSWPSVTSLTPLALPDDFHEFSAFVLNRNHHGQGQGQINAQIRYYFNTPNATTDPVGNFTSYVYLTQINQAMYIRMVSEFCRRSQSYLYGDEGLTMGALYWQLNDIWPGPSWSSIEYSGKWKMLHYYAKKYFAPSMMSMAMEFGNLTVYIVQDTARHTGISTITLSCYAWSSVNPKSSMEIPVKLRDQVSNRVFNERIDRVLEALECTSRESHFLHASWEGALETELVLSTFRNASGLQKPTIKAKLVGMFPNLSIVLTTDRVAPFVWIDTDVPGIIFEENGFLLNDKSKTISLSMPQKAVVTIKDFKITSLMDIYKQ